MRRFAFALLAAWVALNAVSVAVSVPAQVKQIVTFVYVPNPSGGQPVPIGTGFFVGVAATEPGKSFVYFVTAKHIVRRRTTTALHPEILLRLNLRRGGSSFSRIPLSASAPNRSVFTHADDSVDLAVIPIAGFNGAVLDHKFLPAETFVLSASDYKSLGVSEGAEVFFTGLFSQFAGQNRIYPVMRFGKVAMVTDEKIPFVGVPTELYLMETASYGGNSGSPVFLYVPSPLGNGVSLIKLAGVMQGTFLDSRPVVAVPAPVGASPNQLEEQAQAQAQLAMSQSNVGIAAVVPGHKLHDILYGPELTAQRQRSESASVP